MANPENLKPFPPGVSGNPNGRPKGRSLTARLRDLLDQYELEGKQIPDGKQVADLVVEGLVIGSTKGNSRNLQELFNRVEGKVTDRVEHSGPGGGPIAFDATVRDRADTRLDSWRKEQAEKLAALNSSGPSSMPPP